MRKQIPLLMLFLLAPIKHVTAATTDNVGQPIVWQTPYGTFGIPLNATEALIGYDGINKVAIAGFSLPVYTDPKSIIALSVGAVAPWQTNEASIQPYIAIGHDIAREIPYLSSYTSFHLNTFGRWDSGNGKAGAGISSSYGFAGGALDGTASTVPTVPPPVPVQPVP
jgi:hypothetical protein